MFYKLLLTDNLAIFRQSFKGRSKRDKKNGISAVEAKSESEYWHKGQETSIVSTLINALRILQAEKFFFPVIRYIPFFGTFGRQSFQ